MRKDEMKKIKSILKWTTLLVAILAIFILCKDVMKMDKTMIKKFDYNKDFSTPSLDHYYMDFSERKYLRGTRKFHFDNNSIPQTRPYHKGDYIYQPVYISQFALGAHQYFLNTNDVNSLNSFMKCADWLIANLRKHGDFYYWELTYRSEFPESSKEIPRFNAMAQGQGASVLLRAFSETKDDKYLKAAKDAIEPILHDRADGGISSVGTKKFFFPQKCSTGLQAPPSNILNGGISAYFGLYDYLRVTGDPEVKEICDKIIDTFANEIENYDAGYWSLYSTYPKILASAFYNSVHATQLELLYLITGNKKFLIYSKRFEKYQNSRLSKTRYAFMYRLRQLKNIFY